MNHRFTFRSTETHRRAVLKFGGVAAVGLGLNQGAMVTATRMLSLPYLEGQVLASAVVLCWTFTAGRLWTFKARTI